MNVYELLKNEVGLSDVEVNKYFDTRENEKSFVMKLRDKAWLGTVTYRALQLAVEKHGGKYEPRPPTWTIPKDGSNPTPQTPCFCSAREINHILIILAMMGITKWFHPSPSAT